MTGIIVTRTLSASNAPLVVDSRCLKEEIDEPSHRLEDLLKAEPVVMELDDRKENKSPLRRKSSLLSFLRRGNSGKKIRSSNSTVFTDIDSSANSSLMSGSLSSGPSHRRSPGGCLKITTQRESVGMYYGRISGHENSVHWGNMEIRSHAYCLGDNPCCVGPALSCAWEAFESVSVSVDEYEFLRPGKRTKVQMILPKPLRTDLLIQCGYARGELREASEQGAEIRKHRERNARLSPSERVVALTLRLRGKSSSMAPLTHSKAELSDSIRNIDFVREA